METAQSVLQSLRSGDWMISLDLQDAYLQVPVHPQSRRYLRFCLGDQVYQFWVLCFGLSSAPQVSTRVMAPVSSHTSFWILDPSLFRRLVGPWILPAGDHSGEGLPSYSLCRARDSGQLAQELPHTFSALGLSGDDSAVFSFEGFPDSGPGAEGSLSRRRILVLSLAASQSLALPLGGDVIPFHPHSGLQASDAPGSGCGRSSGVFWCVALWILRPRRSLGTTPAGGIFGGGQIHPISWAGWTCLFLTRSSCSTPTRQTRVGARFSAPTIYPAGGLAMFLFSINHSELLAVLPFGVFSSPLGQDSISVHRQYVGSVLPVQGRGHVLIHPQLRGARDSPPLRGFRCSSAPPVCSGSPERFGRLSQSAGPGPWFGMDSPSVGVPRSFPLLAGHGGFIRHLHRLQVYFSPMADPQAAAVDALIQSWDHLQALCLPSFQPYPEGPHQVLRLPQSGADSSGSVLATPALVSGFPRPAGGGSGPSSSSSGSAPSAPLPPVSREPPLAGADWVSHCQRSTRHFGFSARVAC